MMHTTGKARLFGQVTTCLTALLLTISAMGETTASETSPNAHELSPALRASFDEESYEALQRFSAAPARLDGGPDEQIVHTTPACQSRLTPKCARFVRDNREAIASLLPDNPEYWASYMDYLKTTPAVTRIDGEIDASDTSIDRSRIFEAANHWPIAQLIHSGEIDGVQAAWQFKQLRRWSTTETTLLDRMISLAVLGIQIHTLNAALASAAHRGDEAAIDALGAAISPLTPAEISLATSFAIEAEYAAHLRHLDGGILDKQTPLSLYEAERANHQLLIDIYGHEVDEPQLLTQLEIDEQQREADEYLRLSRSYWPLLLALNDASHADYWGESDAWRALRAAPESPTHWAYIEYSHNARMTALHVLVLRALADHYINGQPIAHPSEDAPKHFAWDWREKTRELCLQGVTVNPNLARKINQACLPVWPWLWGQDQAPFPGAASRAERWAYPSSDHKLVFCAAHHRMKSHSP
ncbi:MAG: hypothetical protein NXH85_00420 [Pseudomonadaceae bacterium]|nr:hypothetical protein [Pseudomonadaceae bacterium]